MPTPPGPVDRRHDTRSPPAQATDLRPANQVGEVLAPGVLGAVGQQDDLVGVERVHRALVVGDQHDRAGVGAQRLEHLLPAGRVEVVGRLVEQQHVGARDDQRGHGQPGPLAAGERAGPLVDGVAGEEEGAEDAAQLGVGAVRGGRPHDLEQAAVHVDRLVLLGVVAHAQAVAGLDLAGVGRLGAGQHPQQRRLPGAVEPEDDDAGAPVHGEVDVGEDLQRAVALRQPLGGTAASGRTATGVGKRSLATLSCTRTSASPEASRSARLSMLLAALALVALARILSAWALSVSILRSVLARSCLRRRSSVSRCCR